MKPPAVTVSIVSHRQNALVNNLLADLNRHCRGSVSVIVTENVPDTVRLAAEGLSFPIRVIVNASVKGFGANHNGAFAHCITAAYCVANPDIRLNADPFPALMDALAGADVGVVGPLVRSPQGAIEDSARRFPTIATLAKKVFAARPGPDYVTQGVPVNVDWVAGMFMTFRTDAYQAAGGFDEGFFLYYEDVDICRRLGRAGKRVVYDPRAEVIHDARRASRRDWRLARHHMASMLRYLVRS